MNYTGIVIFAPDFLLDLSLKGIYLPLCMEMRCFIMLTLHGIGIMCRCLMKISKLHNLRHPPIQPAWFRHLRQRRLVPLYFLEVNLTSISMIEMEKRR